jgi:hypothetical protein
MHRRKYSLMDAPGQMAILTLAIFVVQAAQSQTLPTVGIRKDGISASLTVRSSKEAVLNWHFTQPHTTPIDEIVATENGRPLEKPTVIPFPWSNAQTLLVFLLDVTDPRREAQLQADKLALFEIAGHAKAHHQIIIVVYAAEIEPFLPADGNAGVVINRVAGQRARQSPANLGKALFDTLEMLSSMSYDRGAIFVLTDGHSDDSLNVSLLTERALRNDISVTFILSPSERESDRTALEAIASSTGGQVVEHEGRETFVQNPFELLDSGAIARFPLDLQSRYFWQSDPEIKVIFYYGTNQLELKSTAPVPVAGARETAVYIAKNHPFTVAGSGATVLAATTGLILFAVHRRKKRPGADARVEEARRQPVLALLQNIGDGTTYPIQAPMVQVGRADTNEIVLEDETVSRLHAVLQQGGCGTFSIQNRSDLNGTLVNHLPIETTTLADGDLITLGSTTLRFCQQPPAQGNDGSRAAVSEQNNPSSASA